MPVLAVEAAPPHFVFNGNNSVKGFCPFFQCHQTVFRMKRLHETFIYRSRTTYSGKFLPLVRHVVYNSVFRYCERVAWHQIRKEFPTPFTFLERFFRFGFARNVLQCSIETVRNLIFIEISFSLCPYDSLCAGKRIYDGIFLVIITSRGIA